MRDSTDDLHISGIGQTEAEQQQYQQEYRYYLNELLNNSIPGDQAKSMAASMAAKAIRGEALSTHETNALTGLNAFNEFDEI
jgi:hypothetical protein